MKGLKQKELKEAIMDVTEGEQSDRPGPFQIAAQKTLVLLHWGSKQFQLWGSGSKKIAEAL